MKTSVVLATYNGERFLEKQLLSLLEQSRKADEVIITDDASSDRTVEILRAFIATHRVENWTVHVNTENVGYQKNFAAGMARAQGEILFLCDQDDVWHADKIERVLRVFEEHSDAQSVNSSFDVVDGDGNPLSVAERRGWSNHGQLPIALRKGEVRKISSCRARPPAMLVRCNISPGCTMAVRTAVRDAYLASTTYILPHDWELNIIADAMGGMYFCNEALIDYRIHATNAIGLSTANTFPGLSFQERRLAWHQVVEQAIEVSTRYVDDAQFGKLLHTYAVLRREVLEKGKISALIKLYAKCAALYRGIIFPKGRLGDWYTVLTRKMGAKSEKSKADGNG